MENKSMLKKIGLVAILVVILVAIILLVINASSGKKEDKTGSTNTISAPSSSKSANTQNTTVSDNVISSTSVEKKNVKKQELNDGILYTITEDEIVPDIVVGDNYFDTQIADMNLNFDEYEGKTIEIEGLYFINDPYTFVGRYSLSNICPDCPTGYSYFEYEWHGDEAIELKDEEDWIKIVGTLRKGNDGVEYYYIDVERLEVMNEKGIDTVSN